MRALEKGQVRGFEDMDESQMGEVDAAAEMEREREREFADQDPTVLIVGGGQSGLNVAARLKLLDIPTLIVEKNKRVGDQWRNRYQALCLHDPVCESTHYSRRASIC